MQGCGLDLLIQQAKGKSFLLWKKGGSWAEAGKILGGKPFPARGFWLIRAACSRSLIPAVGCLVSSSWRTTELVLSGP